MFASLVEAVRHRHTEAGPVTAQTRFHAILLLAAEGPHEVPRGLHSACNPCGSRLFQPWKRRLRILDAVADNSEAACGRQLTRE